ncbi:DUF4232 domain-containing protein [Streptomyces sp. NPDC050704]|uniref:DUF4232 domain-containing protein n=1 Tax=Streptomyces sp. NPDC050704 TaxID=3157219 RepID=UPI003432A552
MRALPIAVAVLAAALTLTACSDSDGGSDSGDKDTGGKKTSASTACKADQVGTDVAASEAPAAGDSGTVSVTLTNSSGADCTLEGFPGVDLRAGSVSRTVPAEEAAQPEKLTVKPDEAVTFTITYVRGAAGDTEKSAAVKTVKFSLPGAADDTADELSFAWKYGEVALRSKTEPDASVTPFQRTGD